MPEVDRYNLLRPANWQIVQERQRALFALTAALGWDLARIAPMRVVDAGCGTGAGLLELIQLGFTPELLTGVDVDPAALEQAELCLPAAVRLVQSDAAAFDAPPASVDVVVASTLFSSVLADAAQAQLAAALWSWLRPGGGVLWYDFTVPSPGNPRVRAMPLARVRRLFPAARVLAHRVTLAPPLARLVTRVHPSLYTVFSAVPLLRTHALAWLQK